MALMDNEWVFCDAAQYDVATASPETVTNFYDLSSASAAPIVAAGQSRDLGIGADLWVHILVTTLFAAASTDGTVTIAMQSTATLPTPPTVFTAPTTHYTTPAFAEATLIVGYRYDFKFPQAIAGSPYLRYLGFLVTTATQNFSAGNLTIWIDRNSSSNTMYAKGSVFT